MNRETSLWTWGEFLGNPFGDAGAIGSNLVAAGARRLASIADLVRAFSRRLLTGDDGATVNSPSMEAHESFFV